jgi:hypothetical protein
VKGNIDKVWSRVNALIDQDSAVYSLVIMAACESDRGVTYGFPHDDTCGKGQFLVPTPWSLEATSPYTRQTEYGYSFNTHPELIPNNYAVVNINKPALATAGVFAAQGTAFDVEVTIDNTKGQHGTGYWDYAVGPTSSGTMLDAIADPNGWGVWDRGAATEFVEYRPYNIERARLYAYIVVSSINGGPYPGGSIAQRPKDWALSAFDLSGVTIELEQYRYQRESSDRMAMLMASNTGAQQFGISCDVNILSNPTDEEIPAFPVPGIPVKTEDLIDMTRSIPNAQVGEVVRRTT